MIISFIISFIYLLMKLIGYILVFLFNLVFKFKITKYSDLHRYWCDDPNNSNYNYYVLADKSWLVTLYRVYKDLNPLVIKTHAAYKLPGQDLKITCSIKDYKTAKSRALKLNSSIETIRNLLKSGTNISE